MGIAEIIASVDREIALLQQARALLSGAPAPGGRASRSKKGATVSSAAVAPARKTGKKRKLTPEGRRRIAEAVKRRWEAQRKAAAATSKGAAASK